MVCMLMTAIYFSPFSPRRYPKISYCHIQAFYLCLHTGKHMTKWDYETAEEYVGVGRQFSCEYHIKNPYYKEYYQWNTGCNENGNDCESAKQFYNGSCPDCCN